MDVELKSAKVTKYSLHRKIELHWDHDEIGSLKYVAESRYLTRDDIFVSEGGKFLYHSERMYPWSSKPSEVVCSMTYNTIKIVQGIENPQHARPFGDEGRILHDSCWVGKETPLFWSRPPIRQGILEQVLPSNKYDIEPDEACKFSLRGFM